MTTAVENKIDKLNESFRDKISAQMRRERGDEGEVF